MLRVTVASLAALPTCNFPVIGGAFITLVSHHIGEARTAARLIVAWHVAAAA